MTQFVFTCPATSMKVQHWLDGDQHAPENEYEAVTCKACTRLHLVNRRTGKLLGQEE
jgi:NAD-dependent dihydropyrimidine dehydrogenase PreA subunit